MTEKGQMIKLYTVEEMKQLIQESVTTKKLVVLIFTAVWAPMSRVMTLFFSGLLKKMTDVICVQVEVDLVRAAEELWNVDVTTQMPTFIFFKDGEEVARFVGVNKEELKETAERFVKISDDEAKVIKCNKVEELKELIQEGASTKKLVVVNFKAVWSPLSHYMFPLFAALARKMPNVVCVEVDIDVVQTAEQVWNVDAMTQVPTFAFFKDGEEVARVVGAKREELNETAEKYA